MLSQYQIIFIVGLPGSGKTTFAESIPREDGWVVHDDFLDEWWKGSVKRQIQAGCRVCLSDPRLCSFTTFQRIADEVLSLLHENDEILVILFENDVEQCLRNLKRRERVSEKRRRLENSVRNMTTHYDIDQWKEWRTLIRPVWRPDRRRIRE